MTGFLAGKTPGVYITESELPAKVVGVATAVAGFAGYTERAVQDGKSVTMSAVQVRSLQQFEAIFGGAPRPACRVLGAGKTAGDVELHISGIFHFYNSMRLFFLNGGGECYVVSAGGYEVAGKPAAIQATALVAGVAELAKVDSVTMLAVPDAVLLPSGGDYSAVARAMLAQCARRTDRIAILDVFDAHKVTDAKTLAEVIEAFQGYLGDIGLSYAASYFPNLNTSLVKIEDANSGDISFDSEEQENAVSEALLTALNVVPPSGALAGLITLSDIEHGVWNAPANMNLAGVDSGTFEIGDAEVAHLLTPVNGKAVNGIRSLPGRGCAVWGARTMDGNSLDWAHLQARRTVIFLEQSIQHALQGFVFAANDGATWATVTEMISGFLLQVWSEGGLMGNSPARAYNVACGLGSTMTAADIVNGHLRATATVQLVRPDEFIALMFNQQVQAMPPVE